MCNMRLAPIDWAGKSRCACEEKRPEKMLLLSTEAAVAPSVGYIVILQIHQ